MIKLSINFDSKASSQKTTTITTEKRKKYVDVMSTCREPFQVKTEKKIITQQM